LLAVVQVSLAQLVMLVHAEHVRSEVAVHAADWYWPAGQVVEQATHAPPLT
jgi:hypothetical protein